MSTRPELALPLPDEFVDAVARRVADLLAERQAAPPEPVAYTISTLAAELDVTPKTIRGAVHRGELAATRRGARYVIAADAARAWAIAPAPPSSRRGPRTQRRREHRPLGSALETTTTKQAH